MLGANSQRSDHAILDRVEFCLGRVLSVLGAELTLSPQVALARGRPAHRVDPKAGTTGVACHPKHQVQGQGEGQGEVSLVQTWNELLLLGERLEREGSVGSTSQLPCVRDVQPRE